MIGSKPRSKRDHHISFPFFLPQLLQRRCAPASLAALSPLVRSLRSGRARAEAGGPVGGPVGGAVHWFVCR